LGTTIATSRPVAGVTIPDNKLARELTELVKDTEVPLLFHHSSRVYYRGRSLAIAVVSALIQNFFMLAPCSTTWASLLNAPAQISASRWIARTARDFLRSHGIAERDIETVWTAIALHTTPGIPQYRHPVIALVTAGVEMDVLGIALSEFTEAEREAVVHAHPAVAASWKRSSRPFTTVFTTGRKRPWQ
jgi:hypothetical protein